MRVGVPVEMCARRNNDKNEKERIWSTEASPWTAWIQVRVKSKLRSLFQF
jgi:hypothetical protein